VKQIKTIVVFWMLLSSVYGQELLLKDGETLVILGNSITQAGVMPFGYVNQARNALAIFYPERKISLVNAGISGHKAPDMLDRFERDVLQYDPDWLAISVGINDVWHGFKDGHTRGGGPKGVPLELYRAKVTEMITLAQATGTKVALMTTTIIQENLSSIENQKLEPYNEAIHQLAQQYDCLLIDQNHAFKRVLEPLQKPGMNGKGLLTTDGVHMNEKGNWLMASTLLHAFGISEHRLKQGKDLVWQACTKDQDRLDAHLARYNEVNYEVGAPRSDEHRVIFYGSSSIDRWNLADDFPEYSCLNRGIGGEHTRDMVRRFRQDVRSLEPAAMILFLGSGNDFWPDNRYSIAETKSNLLRLSRIADSRGIKVALGAVSPVNDYIPGKDHLLVTHPLDKVQALNTWIETLCRENGYTFIDFYSPVADSAAKLDSTLTLDGMHVNARGYQKWQTTVHHAFEQMGITPKKPIQQ
jgi:lysophospholipase L1-like esterase